MLKQKSLPNRERFFIVKYIFDYLTKYFATAIHESAPTMLC